MGYTEQESGLYVVELASAVRACALGTARLRLLKAARATAGCGCLSARLWKSALPVELDGVVRTLLDGLATLLNNQRELPWLTSICFHRAGSTALTRKTG
jgi:hypothetical protein